MTLKLTWRNLWRNRNRSLITMASVMFAVLLAVLMQSFQKGVFDNLVKNVVGFYYGYLQVHKQGYWDEQVLENSFAYDDSLFSRINQNPNITALVPRIETFILAASGNTSKGCMLTGTDPEKENQLTGIKNKIINGSYFNKDDTEVILAEGLAARLKLTTGDTIVLLGQGYQGSIAAGKYRIKGIVKFGAPELNNGMVYLPLSAAQSLLSAENMLTSLAVAIDKPENLFFIQESVTKETGQEFEVMNWKELMPEIADHIKADSASFYIFTGILYLIIAFGILGTILMMTAERRYEFGMLIAIGMKKSKLGVMLLYETILITLLGVLSGLLICLPFVYYFQAKPIRFGGQMAEMYEQFGFEALFPTAIDSGIFITQSCIVLIIAFVVGLYPVWHVSRINPVYAMKR